MTRTSLPPASESFGSSSSNVSVIHAISLSLSLSDDPASDTSCDDVNDCRTLSTIIFTCLATLTACTWASVHPNIPEETEGKIVVALRRFRLMLLTLLAPEIIILWALRQHMVARGFAKRTLVAFTVGRCRPSTTEPIPIFCYFIYLLKRKIFMPDPDPTLDEMKCSEV